MLSQKDYLQLLNLAYEVAQSLKGKETKNPYLPDCQQLAAKLFFHAASIYQLRQGTKIPVPYSLAEGSNFYDFQSVTVLTRTALETFLTMFEVFFEPDTDDDFEFNHALWKLSGLIVREKFSATAPTAQIRETNQADIQKIKERLQNTKSFNLMKPRDQKSLLKGRRKRDWQAVAKSVGFGKQFIRQIYAYQSGYVHADGLSGIQIAALQTANEQIRFIETQMHIVLIGKRSDR